jgi:hypothetical protein
VDRELKRIWLFSLVVSLTVVATFFWYVNFTGGHDWTPLGYDTYYYLGYISQVVASGPLQFAATQHYVEFLYPILASAPVYLGASSDSVELVLPVVLACATVIANGVLALESGDLRVAILSVSFSAGWFAIYRMGADFDANLLAFPMLIMATTIILRVARKRSASGPVVVAFMLLVTLAAAAHIESTDFFLVTWMLAFALLGGRYAIRSNQLTMFLILAAALIASPFTLAYLRDVTAGVGGQYCAFPPYWLEVFGPAAPLAILGLGILVWSIKGPASNERYKNVLLAWSMLALGIGVLGYVTIFPIWLSDRALLLFPIPIVSSLGLLWTIDHVPRLTRIPQTKLLAILAVVIPLLTVPVVFTYAAPHFRYFLEHGASVVTCSSN